jgi:hypothetical protein
MHPQDHRGPRLRAWIAAWKKSSVRDQVRIGLIGLRF